jgi:hypothetical protein
VKNKLSGPPRLAETLLRWLGAPDYIVGDFVEEFEDVLEWYGRFRANIWFWQQLLRSVPALCQRRFQKAMKSLTKRDRQLFVFGILLLIPALLIGVTGILHSVFGISAPMNSMFDYLYRSPLLAWIVHPAVILGGLLGAFVLNAVPVLQINVRNQEEALVGSLTIRKGYWLHIGVLATAVFFFFVIFLYLLVENL